MTIHKEGNGLILKFFILLSALVGVFYYLLGPICIFYILATLSFGFWLLVISFFRDPNRISVTGEGLIVAPADGKVVVIEETVEGEYFKDKRLQVSIFMSPLNVHIQWYPISGVVKFFKHHNGKFMKAWLPKSSTENERTTLVIQYDEKNTILMRQVAGAIARRIVSYANVGETIDQTKQQGFIKFGSRVDLYLPLGTTIDVKLNQKVTGSQTIIGHLPK